MQSFSPAQLYGTGSIITEPMDSTTKFRFRTTTAQAPNHIYITFDVIGGGSLTVPGLADSNFNQFTISGNNNLHTAYSTTNWAYSFPKGAGDTGAAGTLIGSNLPSISSGVARVRGLGLDRSSGGNVLTILDVVPTGLEIPYSIPAVV